MSIDDTLEAFRKGKFEIDCLEMTLAKMNEKSPVAYKGKGYIHQNEKGKICFKIFCDETNNNQIADIMHWCSIKSGSLVEDEYFRLSASGFDGIIWNSERFLIHASWPINGSPISTGELDVLSTERATSEAAQTLRMHFREHGEVSRLNLTGQIEVAYNDYKFQIQQLDQGFFVVVLSEKAFGNQFHTRIQEAFQFVLARSVSLRVLVRQNDTNSRIELVSEASRSLNTQLDPPLARGLRYLSDSWPLFSAYLAYVTENGEQDKWHACTYHLHNACEASANSMDAWIIGLCVAVEGIVSLVAFEKDEKDLNELALLTKDILKFVSENEQHKQHRERLRGLLGMLMAVSVPDKLYYLQQRNYVAEENVSAWKKLRAKHIHPNEGNPRNWTPEDIQQLFDRINGVTTLMYQVVFTLIGYRGKFTDYGTKNYPVKEFPLTHAGVEAPAASPSGSVQFKGHVLDSQTRENREPKLS